MKTESKEIVAPKASLDFKFRKINLAWILTLTESIKIHLEQSGPEFANAAVFRTAEAWAGKLAEHIVKEFELPNTIEGALQLLTIYNRIFTAAKIKARVEGDVGHFEVVDCTHWDLMCKPLGIRCDENCEKHESVSALKALGDFEIASPSCKPRGGDSCVYKITKK